MRLSGKRVLITGAASGIGEATARRFAAEGAAVMLADLNLDAAQAVADDIATGGAVIARAVAVDVTDDAQVALMIEVAIDTLGAIDIIVNNAGRWGKSHKAEDTPLDEWRDVVEQNLTGVLIPCLAAGKQMIKQGSGKIINISST